MIQTEINLSFPFTLLNRIHAAFALIPQRKLNIVIHAIIPIIGLSTLAMVLYQGHPVSTEVVLIVFACFMFTPSFVVLGVAITYYLNKAAREPFTYKFDAGGVHISTATYEFTHKWSAISQVKRFGGFLMFFFSPGQAHCIPIGVVQRSGELEQLLQLAQENDVEVAKSGT